MNSTLKSSQYPLAQRVWDLPTRLFHWTLVVLILLQFGTAEFGWLSMEWHYRFGYATLALLLFRIAWGFAGSQTSRFADFLRGPRALARYVRAELSVHESAQVGHNPLGGWSVIAMLLALLVQTLSGLITSDGIENDGPFVDRAPGAWVRFATHLHHLGENVLLALIGLHIAAVLLHWLLRHDDLVLPMITGRKRVVAPPLQFISGWRALLMFSIAAAAVLLLAYFGT
jgi:cytochrome b